MEPFNYSTYAIPDLKKYSNMTSSLKMQKSSSSINVLCELLERSVKFMLPNCAALIDISDLQQKHIDIVRAPFPIFALEIPWQPENAVSLVGDFEDGLSTKRIALCIEAKVAVEYFSHLALTPLLSIYPDGGVLVVPISWANEHQTWMSCMGGMFLPYGAKTFNDIGSANEISRIEQSALEEAGHQFKKKMSMLQTEPVVLMPEVFDSLVGEKGPQKAWAQLSLDTRDEVTALLQFCNVVNCANVSMADLPSQDKINKKRIAKGKQPFFSYKVLELAEERAQRKNLHQGGSHSSPRMHLRRGHIRRHPTTPEKTVWVRPAVVNQRSPRGLVDKDYSISLPKK